MIDYYKIYHALQHIIAECSSDDEITKSIDSINYTASWAIKLMDNFEMVDEDEKKEKELVGKLENLHAFLHGAHNASSESEASGTFHLACHTVQEIIQWVKND